MCLDSLSKLPKPKKGIGYKTVKLSAKGWKSAIYPKGILPFQSWITDVGSSTLATDITNEQYDSGFHVWTGTVRYKLQAIWTCNWWRHGRLLPKGILPKRLTSVSALIRVSFRDVVAFGAQDVEPKDNCVVCRQIKVTHWWNGEKWIKFALPKQSNSKKKKQVPLKFRGKTKGAK